MKANKVRMILAGMMAASMVLSAVPAMAQEETEVQTEAAEAQTEVSETEGATGEAAEVAEPVSEEAYLCGMWGTNMVLLPDGTVYSYENSDMSFAQVGTYEIKDGVISMTTVPALNTSEQEAVDEKQMVLTEKLEQIVESDLTEENQDNLPIVPDLYRLEAGKDYKMTVLASYKDDTTDPLNPVDVEDEVVTYVYKAKDWRGYLTVLLGSTAWNINDQVLVIKDETLDLNNGAKTGSCHIEQTYLDQDGDVGKVTFSWNDAEGKVESRKEYEYVTADADSVTLREIEDGTELVLTRAEGVAVDTAESADTEEAETEAVTTEAESEK